MSSKILDKIHSPVDLKNLLPDELRILAQEIRQKIISTVSKTGGHLGPNLGVVELTIGLHRALDSPKDKIVWDVGHQSYVHKLLTGRKDQFDTIRQYGGLGGFPKRSESEHDVFDTGHASNSISIALGLAEARDKRGTGETIVAVIGDGSLTGGMAYEALNQAGHLRTKLMVILNDNEMSIANNVGAMSSYLSRIRLDPAYNRIKEEIEQRIKRIPAVGEMMYTIGGHIKESLKHLLVPGMIFEELGIKYVGPIDGHNIESVEQNIRLAKEISGPVLIHILTRKGRGYPPAERNPDKFHGTAPFVIETGEPKKKSRFPSYTEIFGDTLVELAKENQQIVAITAAMPSGTGLDKFADAFPDRFFDVGIAEQHAVTFAAGLSLGGLLPVVAIYSTFLERAYDQIIQDICLQDLHVVFAIDRAGLVGEDGPTHHGAFDLTYLRHIPNMVVMAPKDEDELCHMLYTAINIESPVAVRYPRGSALGVKRSKNFNMLKIGEGEILKEGKNVCFLAIGRMVNIALKAAEILEGKGISCTVVNARFVKPLDERLIYTICPNHDLTVTLEENSSIGGFGSGVLEVLNDRGISLPLLKLGLPDEFITHGSIDDLLSSLNLDAPGVASTVEDGLKKLDKLVEKFDRDVEEVSSRITELPS
ncbi:MAG: 1-deoxy-D-xylulose-5-phosphate synthase [Actinomycetota bacterium]|nr:1-deoxy-D-xylulose-5-phosphate synthase [Actinomycetota bacterium]